MEGKHTGMYSQRVYKTYLASINNLTYVSQIRG
jgi:hypothetical protein